MAILNEHAPLKEEKNRGNNAPFMNKTLSKAFIERSKRKNMYNKYPTEETKSHYNKQRNYCVNLLCKQKKKHYYNNLEINVFNDNKKYI